MGATLYPYGPAARLYSLPWYLYNLGLVDTGSPFLCVYIYTLPPPMRLHFPILTGRYLQKTDFLGQEKRQTLSNFRDLTVEISSCPLFLDLTFRLPGFPTFQLPNFLTFQLAKFPTSQLANIATFQLPNLPTFQLSSFPTFQLSNFPAFQLFWA